MWFINRTMVDRPPTAAAWASAQSGLNELLFSPAVKWRAGVELKRQAAIRMRWVRMRRSPGIRAF